MRLTGTNETRTDRGHANPVEQKKVNAPTSLRTVAGYFIFGVLWILLSDNLLLLFVPQTSPAYVTIQSIKGWLFVSLSALVIYFILKNDIRALETSEAHLRGILNAAPDAMVILGESGQIVLANQQVRQVFGYAPEELIGQGVDFLMPERFRTEHRRHQRDFFHAPHHRADPSMTLYGMRKDGREFPVNINLSHQTIGGELFVIAAIRDITEWKAAEGILRESRELYQELFESNPQPMWVYDLETLAFKMVNDAAVAHYGYTREEFLGMTLQDIRPAEELPALLANLAQPTQPIEKSSGWRHLKKDGAVIDVEISSHATEFNGRPARLVLAHDVTERKRAEDALKQSEELFRLTFENANIGVCLVGLDGRLLRVNQRMCDMLGYSRPVLEAMTVNSIAYPDDTDLSPRFMQQAASGPEKHGQFEKRYLHKQGHIIWGQVSSTLIQDQQGQPLYFVSHVLDITDQKRAETALIVSEENYRSLAETTESAIVVLDREGSILYANPASLRILSDPHMVGKTVFDYYPEEYTNNFLPIVRHVIDNQTTVTEELETLIKGSLRWFRLTMSPLKNPDGSVNALLLNAWERTEEKQAEIVLRESEERYRALFEDVPVAIFEEDFSESKKYLDALQQQGVTDLRAYFAAHPEEVLRCENLIRILDVNNTAVQMFEANSKEELLIATRQTSSQGELENSLEDMLAIAEGRTSHSWEGSDETLTGRQIEINLSWSVMPGHEEDYSKVIVTTKDVTTRKQAEDALKRNERVLRLFVEHSPASIAMFDRDMRYIVHSRRYLADYQLPQQDLTGLSHYEVFPEIPERWKEIHRRCLAGSIERADEDPFPRLDGRQDWVHWEIHPWYDDDGSIGGIILFSEVITERVQARDAIRESERQMRALVSSLDDIVFEFDAQGTYLNVWGGDESHLAQPKAQILGRRMAEVLGEESARPFEEAIRRVLAGGDSETIEYPLEVIGGMRWFMAQISPIQVPGEAPQTASMLVRDITQRKQAEEDLKESEERFSTAFHTNPVSQSIITLETNEVVAVNDACCRLFGYPREELVGAKTADLHLWANPAEEMSAVEELLREGRMRAREATIRMKSGELRTIIAEITPISWKGVPCLITSSFDITERKQAEEARLESEQRYRQTLDSMMEGCQIIDFDWRYIYINEEAARQGRSTREALLHRTMMEAYPGIEATEMFQTLRDCMENRVTRQIENEFKYPDGSNGWFDLSIQPVAEGIFILSNDITERKRAETALRASEAKYRSLVTSWDTSIGLMDADGRYVYINETGAEWYGKTPPEMIGKTLQDLFPDRYKEAVPQPVREVFERNQGTVYESESRFDNGRWFRVSIQPVSTPDGRVTHVTINSMDITERKLTELEIRLRNEDLLLINALNDTANRGEGIEIITEIFARETRKVFNCQDAAIYLLSPDGEYLEMQNTTVSPQVTERIEKMIGISIPRIRLPVLDNGHIQTFLTSQEGNIVDDPAQIRAWIAEFTQTTSLPKALRPVVRKLVPQIAKLLNIRSLITVPLVSAGRVIGLMELSSRNSFSHEDLQRVRSIIYQVTTAILRKQAETNVQKQIKRLTALNRIDLAINSGLDLRLSLDVVLNETLLQLGADSACILLLNKAGYQLEYMAGKGFRSAAITQTQLRLGEGYAGRVGLERKTLHIPDLEAEAGMFVRKKLLQKEDFVEYFGVPLIAKGELKGVLEVFNRSNLHPDLEWLNYLETLGGQAAIAIDNLQMFEGLQQSNQELAAAYDATIAGWSHAMDLRDKETEGHTLRVTDLTVRLAKRMHVSQKEMVHIRRGALLHDIGKLGVPDQILLKPGKLTDEEWTIMRRHPTYAYEMLLPIYYLKPALDIPYCHHEKWDGSGYPRGLKGEQIPLSARIFAIVDVWDALRSDRPYRPGWELERIREYILEQSGKHFDPHVVEAFMELMSEGE